MQPIANGDKQHARGTRIDHGGLVLVPRRGATDRQNETLLRASPGRGYAAFAA
jgi:hypothetical protein